MVGEYEDLIFHERVAIKAILPQVISTEGKRLMREIDILRFTHHRHPCVLSYSCVFVAPGEREGGGSVAVVRRALPHGYDPTLRSTLPSSSTPQRRSGSEEKTGVYAPYGVSSALWFSPPYHVRSEEANSAASVPEGGEGTNGFHRVMGNALYPSSRTVLLPAFSSNVNGSDGSSTVPCVPSIAHTSYPLFAEPVAEHPLQSDATTQPAPSFAALGTSGVPSMFTFSAGLSSLPSFSTTPGLSSRPVAAPFPSGASGAPLSSTISNDPIMTLHQIFQSLNVFNAQEYPEKATALQKHAHHLKALHALSLWVLEGQDRSGSGMSHGLPYTMSNLVEAEGAPGNRGASLDHASSRSSATSHSGSRSIMGSHGTRLMMGGGGLNEQERSLHLYIVMPYFTGDLLGFVNFIQEQPCTIGHAEVGAPDRHPPPSASTTLHASHFSPNFLAVSSAVLCFQMAMGIDMLHQSKIVHRDLKPENILVNLDPKDPYSSNAVLADFGLARDAEESETMYVCTRFYRPPELIARYEGASNGSDIWSVGCILFEVCTGKTLFEMDSSINDKGVWDGGMASEQLEIVLNVVGSPSMEDIENYCPAGNPKEYLLACQRRYSRVPNLFYDHFRLHGCTPQEKDMWLDLIVRCLSFFPSQRPTAEEVCRHMLFMHYGLLYVPPQSFLSFSPSSSFSDKDTGKEAGKKDEEKGNAKDVDRFESVSSSFAFFTSSCSSPGFPRTPNPSEVSHGLAPPTAAGDTATERALHERREKETYIPFKGSTMLQRRHQQYSFNPLKRDIVLTVSLALDELVAEAVQKLEKEPGVSLTPSHSGAAAEKRSLTPGTPRGVDVASFSISPSRDPLRSFVWDGPTHVDTTSTASVPRVFNAVEPERIDQCLTRSNTVFMVEEKRRREEERAISTPPPRNPNEMKNEEEVYDEDEGNMYDKKDVDDRKQGRREASCSSSFSSSYGSSSCFEVASCEEEELPVHITSHPSSYALPPLLSSFSITDTANTADPNAARTLPPTSSPFSSSPHLVCSYHNEEEEERRWSPIRDDVSQEDPDEDVFVVEEEEDHGGEKVHLDPFHEEEEEEEHESPLPCRDGFPIPPDWSTCSRITCDLGQGKHEEEDNRRRRGCTSDPPNKDPTSWGMYTHAHSNSNSSTSINHTDNTKHRVNACMGPGVDSPTHDPNHSVLPSFSTYFSSSSDITWEGESDEEGWDEFPDKWAQLGVPLSVLKAWRRRSHFEPEEE